MTVRWLTSALKSMQAACLFIAYDNPVAARVVCDRIERAVEHLGQFPHAGRQGTVPGTREVVVAGLPYVVVYRVAESEVQILRVFHAKQDWH